MDVGGRPPLSYGIVVVAILVGVAALLLVLAPDARDASADPCYGYGVLESTRSYPVSEDFALRSALADVVAGGDETALEPGEVREARVCRVDQFRTVTLDGESGGMLSRFMDVDAMMEYYAEHPEEFPPVKTREAFEQGLQDWFVPVPASVLGGLETGCDPAWVETEFLETGVVICHPASWHVQEDSGVEGRVGSQDVNHSTVEVGVLGVDIESHNTKCLEPTVIETNAGATEICAVKGTVFARIGYGVALPIGRNVGINVFNDATPAEERTALRVALSIELLR